MHSISTRPPCAMPVVPNELRAGRLSEGKNLMYASFIAAQSFMSARNTVHLATWSSPDPARCNSWPILLMADVVSPAMPDFALSTPICPATNRRFPARTTPENGLFRELGTRNSGIAEDFAAEAGAGAADGAADEHPMHRAASAENHLMECGMGDSSPESRVPIRDSLAHVSSGHAHRGRRAASIFRRS